MTANAVEPGFVKTNMKVPFPFSLFSFMRDPVEKGAWITVHAVTAPELTTITGKFLNKRGVEIQSSAASYDEDSARSLGEISAELAGVGSGDRLRLG